MDTDKFKNGHLLVLDDNAFDVELINIDLNQSGAFKIDHAKNRDEFFKFFEQGEYIAIISDYNIPGVSTLDIMQEIRQINKLIPYIFVSGTVGEEQAVELLKMGATDYVLKDNLQKLPFTLSRAINEMEMALAKEKALQELMANERKFRNILDFAPDATLLVDENGKIQFANNQAVQLFGYSTDEFFNIELDDLLPLRFRSNHAANRNRFVSNPSLRTMGEGMNLFALRKDGTEFPTDISISPISDDKFGKALTVCSVRDVTVRKKAEQEIIKKKNLLNDAQKLAKVGSWEWDLQTNDVDWSEELYNIVGIEDRGIQLKFEELFDLMHPEDKDAMIEASKNKVKSEKKFSPQFRIYTPSGELKYLKSTEHQTLDENDKVVQITGTIQDITEAVQAEKEKRELQKRALEELEEQVKLRTAELFESNHALELRNNEITDSINYAEYIQRAVLSKEEDCAALFPESFVLWMPKDVVSGDFFWCHSDDKYDYMAVADCTGHGVPGAFMSIISNQYLQNIVIGQGITQPKHILSTLNELLISGLKQKTGIVNDGMDIVIVRINKQNNTMIFAGAQRPLLLFSENELKSIEGNKFGIGGFLIADNHKEFDEIEVPYAKGDIAYLTTDGYSSQFGGKKGKKMMKKRMEKYILSHANDPLPLQKEKLLEYYKDWQANEEQVDDVLIIGVQL